MLVILSLSLATAQFRPPRFRPLPYRISCGLFRLRVPRATAGAAEEQRRKCPFSTEQRLAGKNSSCRPDPAYAEYHRHLSAL